MTCECSEEAGKMPYDSRLNFLPSEQNIDAEIWVTELDRIQVVQWDQREEYRIRLIGPGCSIDICVEAAKNGALNAAMEFSREPMPESSRTLVEYNVTGTVCYFADAYVPLRRRGLDRWIYTRPPRDSRLNGSRSWT
jgi:hypothetical protein